METTIEIIDKILEELENTKWGDGWDVHSATIAVAKDIKDRISCIYDIKGIPDKIKEMSAEDFLKYYPANIEVLSQKEWDRIDSEIYTSFGIGIRYKKIYNKVYISHPLLQGKK